MKSFDDMRQLSDAELLAYLAEEAEAVILSAAPEKQLALRAFFARLRSRSAHVKDPLARASMAYGLMLDGLPTFQEALK